MVGNELEDGAGVIAAVGDGVPGRLKAVKEGRHGSLVRGLARGEREAARQAATVDDDVDFGAQPASRASDGVIRTPFFSARGVLVGAHPPRRRGDEEIPASPSPAPRTGAPAPLAWPSGCSGCILSYMARSIPEGRATACQCAGCERSR